MCPAPVMETARLRLRPHRIEDFEPMMALMETGWARFMGGPYSRRESWWFLAAEVGSWELLGFGSWGVELKDRGTFVGQVGINRYAHWPEVELGWSVWPDHEGRGIAFEAAQAARDWAFGPLGRETLVSYIDPENARSMALAERLGAVRDDEAARPEPGDLVYRHARPEHV